MSVSDSDGRISGGVGARPDLRKHEPSGLRVQAVTGPDVWTCEQNIVPLPPCCPISGNPRDPSSLILTYLPRGWCLEVYSLRQLVERFVGGWKGNAHYPAERNMEGMIRLLVQMAADALGQPVSGRAYLTLDTGAMRIRAKATPNV